jgi:hypothetical protein
MSLRAMDSSERWTLKNSTESSTRRVFAHAGGVNQNIFLPHAVGFDLERHVNRIARRAGNGRDDDALGLVSALMMEDLPTFGRPTMASFKRPRAGFIESSRSPPKVASSELRAVGSWTGKRASPRSIKF